jgi:hypothetical protein
VLLWPLDAYLWSVGFRKLTAEHGITYWHRPSQEVDTHTRQLPLVFCHGWARRGDDMEDEDDDDDDDEEEEEEGVNHAWPHDDAGDDTGMTTVNDGERPL